MGQGGFDSGPPGDSDLISNSGWETVVGQLRGRTHARKTHTRVALFQGWLREHSPPKSCSFLKGQLRLLLQESYLVYYSIQYSSKGSALAQCDVQCELLHFVWLIFPVMVGESNGHCTRTYGGMTRRCSEGNPAGPKVERKNFCFCCLSLPVVAVFHTGCLPCRPDQPSPDSAVDLAAGILSCKLHVSIFGVFPFSLKSPHVTHNWLCQYLLSKTCPACHWTQQKFEKSSFRSCFCFSEGAVL